MGPHHVLWRLWEHLCMAYTERGISGLCCQPVPPGKLYQSGAGEELVQLSSEEQPGPCFLNPVSHSPWF